MIRPQFGFLIAFLFVAVWAIAGFGIAAAAILAGLLGWFSVRVINGEVNVSGLANRAGAENRRR